MTTITAPHTPPAVDYSRKWYVMLAVGLSLFLETIDTSIVNLALPTLVRSFGMDFSVVQWVVLSFVLTQATLMLVVGRLGDMIGKKRIFLIGLCIASIGSVLCGLSPSIWWLIGFRVLQGVGVAMAIALGMGIVTEAFPPAERGLALGTIGATVSVGIVVGPIAGGWLLEALSWRWIFFVTVPLALINIPVALRYLPDSRPTGRQRFDFLGAFTFFLCLLTFLLGMTAAQQDEYGDQRALLLFVTSLVLLVVFVMMELRIQQPMIDLQLFRSTLFSVNILLRMLSFVVFVGVILLLPFYLEEIRGLTPQESGMLVIVPSIFAGIAAPVAGQLSDKLGTHRIVISGLILMLVGCYSLSTLGPDTSTLSYILRLIPFGLGMGVFQAPNNSVIFGLVPTERLGMTSGLMSVVRTLGRSFGIAIIGGFWSTRVMHYARNAETPSLLAETAGMQEAFLLATGILLLTLALSGWSAWRDTRGR